MNAAAGVTEVRVPDLGNFKDVAVIDVLVKPGDTVVVDTVSGWPEVAPEPALYRPDHYEIATKLKPVLGAHILTGPIAVRGAEPGDTLEGRVKAIKLTADWGWSVIRPLRGTLPEDFPQFQRWTIPIDRKSMTAKLASSISAKRTATFARPASGATDTTPSPCRPRSRKSARIPALGLAFIA